MRLMKVHRVAFSAAAMAAASIGNLKAFADEGSGLRVPAIMDIDAEAYQADSLYPDHEGETDLEIVRERYPDGKVKVERQVTLDEEGNYINHGAWKMFNPLGDVVAEGQFDMGMRVGWWSRWHGRKDAPVLSEFPINNFKPPFHSRANFVDDQLDGEWLIVDSAQRKCLQITLSNGKRDGMMTIWLPNGNVFRQATYDHGVPVGDVLEVDKRSGELKKAAVYLDGRKLITKTDYHPRTKLKKSEEQYLAATTVEKSPDDYWTLRLAEYAAEGEDLRHGTSKSWYANGKVHQEGSYHNGQRTGTITYYYDNGQVAVTGEYQNDAPVDVWVWWHRNGQKATLGQYVEGKQTGDWRWWNEDGKIAVRKTYDATSQAATDYEDAVETSLAPQLVPIR